MQIPAFLQPIILPQDNVFHRGGNGLYLVGNERLALIDTGNIDHLGSQVVLERLRARRERSVLHYILITHCHRDHVGGLAAICDGALRLGGPRPEVRAHPLSVECLRREWDFPCARPLLDGEDTIVDGVALRALCTPGHSEDHLCFFEPESATLFSGDLVLGASTSIVTDLTTALSSLRRLLALRPRLLCPGHGPMLEDGTRRVRTYIAHRYLRERQILQHLSRGPHTSGELTAAIYSRIDRRLLSAAERNVLSHLQKLKQEGRVVVLSDGVPRFALTNGGVR
ncbi:MAG: MBL fold metallo-hydrolase [Bacteroidetes bacterium]|nr:MBL fold metallo-hydrolase [Bacteroidota bacterium]MCL5027118.1 MBL fold metallo-hydrolase [Chloroflexota bacterium]